MKSIIIFAFALFIPFLSDAAQDRFGSSRDEITRSSYTESTDVNVVISSGTGQVLRGVSFSGVSPTTITFYDANIFTTLTSTRAKVFWPGGDEMPVYIPLDIYIGSGTMYNKQGGAFVIIKQDFIDMVPTGTPYRP